MSVESRRSEHTVPLWQRRINQAREQFLKDTCDHQMTVLRNDGLYRHVRFSQPGSSVFSYDLLTWPHHLAITGDMGSLLFRRSRDMFSFFDTNGRSINPDYWSEKIAIPGGSSAVEEFLDSAYVEHVQDLLADWVRDLEIATEDAEFFSEAEQDAADRDIAALTEAVQLDLISTVRFPTSNREAIELLQQFTFTVDEDHPAERYEITDAWELNFERPTTQYLWLCWGITSGVHEFSGSQESLVSQRP